MPELNEVLTDGIEQEEPQGIRRTLVGYDDIDYESHRSRILRKQVEESNRESVGFWDTLSVARESEWLTSAASRYQDRNQQIESDPDWGLEPEQVGILVTQMDDREMSYLMASLSADDYNNRLQDVQEDRERSQKLAQAGVGGIAAQLSMALLDPSMILITAATGGLAIPARLGRMAKAIRYAGIGAAESAAVEAYLAGSDTQRGIDDIIMAGMAGGVLGGAIGAVRRVVPDGSPDTPIIRSMDELDAKLSRTADAIDQQNVIDATISVRAGQVVDAERINTQVMYNELFLKSEAGGPKMTRIIKKKLTGQKTKTEEEIANLNATKISAVADYWARAGVNRGIKRMFDEARVDAIAQGFDNQTSVLHMRLNEINQQFVNADNVSRADTDLKAWNKMSEQEKVDNVFPNGTPQIQKLKQAQIRKITKLDEGYSLRDQQLMESARPPREVEPGTVGAAKTPQELLPDDRIYNNPHAKGSAGQWLSESMYAQNKHDQTFGKNWKGIIPRLMLGDYTNLDMSVSDEVRSLAQRFLENPQGFSQSDTAAMLVQLNDAAIRYAQGGRLQRGFEAYLQEQKTNTIRGHYNPRYRAEFESQVASAIRDEIPDSQLTDAVKMARDGTRAQFQEALRLRKEKGEYGFGTVSSDPNYFPDIMSREGIDNLLYKDGIDADEIKEFIRRGYKNGDNELSEAQAAVVADVKFNNMSMGRVLDGDTMALYRANSLNEAVELLKQAKVPKARIDAFVADIGSKEDWAQVSSRARKSLKIDWETEMVMGDSGKTYKIKDIMNTNVSQVTEAYTKESSFGSAMAEIGIKSEAQLTRIMQLAREEAFDDIRDRGIRGKNMSAAQTVKSVENDFKRIDDTIRQMRGQSLVDYRDNGFNAAMRRLLDYTGIIRLQQMAFATLPEMSHGITTAGLGTMMKSVPGSGMFRMPGKLAGRSAEDLRSHQRDMAEIEDMVGFVGEDDFVNTFTVRGDDFGSEGVGDLTRKLDNTMEGTRRIASWMSGYKSIQNGFEKVTARAMNGRLKQDALGQQAMTKSQRNQLRQSGVSDERWTEISDWLKANRNQEDFSGRKVDTWNFSKMDSKMKRDLQISLSRMMHRNMQRGLVGETNSQWLGAGGRFLTQFKNYSLVSLEKQLVAGARGDMTGLTQKMMWGTGLAYASYAAQVNLRALGRPEKERDTYLDERLTGANAAWGTLNKHSQLAALGLVVDPLASFGATTGLIGDDYFDTTRHGYQRGLAEGIAPAIGVAEDAYKAAHSVGKFIGTGDEADFNKAARHSLGLLPYTKTIYIGDAMKTAAGFND